MVEFFKPLRRKTGVVTLVMALALMVGWMRSNVVGEVIKIGTICGQAQQVRSERGDVWWMSYSGSPTATEGYQRWEMWTITDKPNEPDYFRSFLRNKLPWYQRWQIRFDKQVWNVGVPPSMQQYIGYGFIFPYGTLTIPLTMISLWLLLSKPRPSNQQKAAELIPETVA